MNALPDMTITPQIPTKVLGIVCGSRFEPPDAYDNLPEIIRWCTDLLRDPWCPMRYHDDLKRMLRDANEQLMAIRAPDPEPA